MSQSHAGGWYVVQVMPQRERVVNSLLEFKGYQSFAPTYGLRRHWSDRAKKLEVPLFPGYVFFRSPGTRVSSLVCSTPGVVRILSFGGRASMVPDSEIDAVQRLTTLGKPQPAEQFIEGQRVEVTSGPFAGVVGIVRKTKSKACLVVSVELIAQSIYVELEEDQIGLARGASLIVARG